MALIDFFETTGRPANAEPLFAKASIVSNNDLAVLEAQARYSLAVKRSRMLNKSSGKSNRFPATIKTTGARWPISTSKPTTGPALRANFFVCSSSPWKRFRQCS